MDNEILDDELQKLLDNIKESAKDIYAKLGSGYNESVYHNALQVALRLKNINYQSEIVTPVYYLKHNVGFGRVDLMVSNKLIIELKAIQFFNSETGITQIKNYMKHHNIQLGLIINFGQPNKFNTGNLSMRLIYDDKIYDYSQEKDVFYGRLELSA